ncbi:hypothetical protein AAWM_00292 [Aspergillus awamori]|uniref:Uncharacterized protein n=2 Tax=Aspergillus TaxID=5052 RepID=A0A3F3Q312_9EURO|nr:hypothetical protein BDQ94DRAFT_170217 [Aspergillus welwitschiae]RDH33614.1 hypothetical protein BDQ94DRAFT_170217 [Aspergillus welwitschiae]GCB17407.1 hypothetical protein AAWM_00292 [Aspergillus awamori]GKZ52526.1 hypothetical protein AnigIFM49718_000408 [Aspergillus niger]GKZ66836.1 hypothetical protein AnigIFM50267_000924 [Aspergillus niger]
MSFSIDAGGTNPFSISVDRTPLVLDESTRTLYNRAISNPSSLTDQERRLITHRPPPDEEDTLCRNACGLSMGELVTKAINSSNNHSSGNDGFPLSSPGLSYKEASLLTAGVVQGQSGHILFEVARLSSEDRDLKARAMEAATTDDIRTAREAAQRVEQRWLEVELAAAKALNDDDIRNIRFAMKVPWQEHVLQSSSAPARDYAPGSDSGPGEEGRRFGLVVIYPKEDEGGRLSEYKSLVGTAVYHGLHYSPRLIKDETRDRFTLNWVAVAGSNNSMDPSALRSKFSTMLSNNEILAGFRRDVFLYVDDEAFRSRETTRPYLWLAEPAPNSESKTERELEPGTEIGTGTGAATGAQPEALQPLKVDIKHIAPTLFARLVQRDLQGEARRKPYRHTSELTRLHAAANARYREERDGIWPPPARFQ